MEEEGDVVYFETSPAAEQLKEAAGDMSANIFTSSLNSRAPDTNDSTATEQNLVSLFFLITQFLLNTFYELAMRVAYSFHVNFIDNLLAPTATKVHYTDKMVGLVKDSALLTEEDCQVLNFVLSESGMTRSKIEKQHSQDDWSTSHVWYWAVLIGLVAVAVVLAPIGWVWCGGVTVVTCVMLVTVIMLLRRSHRLSIQDQFQQLEQYLMLCDSLLSLLTQCVRSIQEQEVVYTGYDRLSRGVPVARLDSAVRSYQSVPLRKRVLSVCRRGVMVMGASTRFLVDEFSTNEELDCRQQYLAFSDLQSIHDASVSDQDDYSYDHLSLESLKTAANLLAVQNSELLKRTAVVLHYHGLWAGSGLLQLVSEFESELRWGLDYQKNCVLDSPPVRPSTSSSSPPTKQQLVLSEMHHADLHAMAALKRVREFEDSVSKDHLQLILSSLNTAASHVTVAIDLLSDRPKQRNTQEIVTEEEREKEEEEEGEECTQVCSVQEDSDSEEEMVFEAYATVSSVESRIQGETHDIDTKEQRESSAQMLRELHSVLTVRNITREEKRERKKARGKGRSTQSPPSKPQSEHPPSRDNDPLLTPFLPPPSETANRLCINDLKTSSSHAQSKENSNHQLPSGIAENSDFNQDPTHSHSSLSPHVLSEQENPPTDSNITTPHSFRHTSFSEMATALSQVITASRSTKRQRRHREEEVCGEGEREQQESEEFQ